MAKCALCIEPDLVLLCGSTDFSAEKSPLTTLSIENLGTNFNVSARSLLTSLARNISVCHFFLLVCSIFSNVGPLRRTQQFAHANGNIDRRARGGCASGPASLDSRVPSLLGDARASVGVGWSGPQWGLESPHPELFSFGLLQSVALLSDHPHFFVESVAGFAGFYLPGLSPDARSDGAAAFGARKSPF